MGGPEDLHLLFFPFMAPGHMIPMMDMAKLFASRGGVRSTIVTTAANLDNIPPSFINNTEVEVSVLPFNPTDAGLPDGAENISALSRHEDQVRFAASLEGALREPFETLIRESAPDAIVTDYFLPWSADVAADIGVPRLMFHGSGFFPMCASHSSMKWWNLEVGEGTIFSSADKFVLPDLPHRIEMSRAQIQHPSSVAAPFRDLLNQAFESMHDTYGVVTNSFYDLEPDYADLYRENMITGKKNSWHIGPLSLCNRSRSDMSTRGGGEASSITNTKCLDWLDAKEPRSVVYVCFGSLCKFVRKQLTEIARALVSSGHRFLWVIRNGNVDDDKDLGLPDHVEEQKRGLVIRGWAPQLSILNHEAIGAFVMHCGWNSCMEGITAGVPMVTWPLFAEQFFNERLVVEVLKVGVPVGSKNYAVEEENRIVVTWEEIRKAIEVVMGDGDEAEERRKRACELRRLAEKAVDVGGSSYNQLDDLLQNLKGFFQKNKTK